MPTGKDIVDEISKIKRENSQLKKRVSSLEQEVFGEVTKPVSAPQKSSSGSSDGGLILIILGILFSLTVIGAVLGIPLIIIGIVLMTRKSTVSEEKVVSRPKSYYAPEEEPYVQEEVYEEPIESKSTKQVVKQKNSEFELKLGIKWFSFIGILALVIGVGFFLKYAIDQGYINHLARIILGIVVGTVLVIVGRTYSDKLKQWGLTLMSGGFAICYFSVYAAYHFIDYRNAIGIPFWLDIVLLTIVAGIMIAYALKDDSQVIASQAFILGFVTSLLSANADILTLVYTFILALSIVFLTLMRKWIYVGIGGIFATYLSYIVWLVNNQTSFWTNVLFLSIYAIIFTLMLIRIKRSETTVLSILINKAFYFALMYGLINRTFPDNSEYVGLFTLLFAFVQLGLYYASGKGQEHLYIGLASLTITVPMIFDVVTTTMLWGVEALLFALLYSKGKKILQYPTYVLGGFLALKIVYDIIESSTIYISLGTGIVVYLLGYILLSKSDNEIANISSWLGLASFILLVILKGDIYSIPLFAAIALVLAFVNKDMFHVQSNVLGLCLILRYLLADLHGEYSLLFGLVTATTFYLLYYINIKVDSDTSIVSSWIGVIVTTVVIFQHSPWVVPTLALYAVILGLLNKKEIQYQPHLLSLLTFITFIVQDLYRPNNVLFATAIIIAFAVLAKVSKPQWIFVSAANIIAFFVIFVEMAKLNSIMVSVGWGILAVVIFIAGLLLKERIIRLQGLGLLVLVIFKVFLWDLGSANALSKTLSFLILGVLLLGVSFIYSKYKKEIMAIL